MNRLALGFVAASLLALSLAAAGPAWAGPQDGTWSDLAPPERGGHAAIYDALRDRMVIVGGYDPAGSNLLNDTWTLALSPGSTWIRQATTGAPPAWSTNFTALADPNRDRMLLLLGGGHFGVWALSFATMTWQALATSGTIPIVTRGASCVYEPLRDRVLVFGGDETCPHGPCPHNEVWSLSLAGTPTWSLLAVAGPAPPPRLDHTAIYDPVRDRMIAFAGMGEYYSMLNDVWALDLGGAPVWIPLAPSGLAPPARQGYLSRYDPVADRMLVSGISNGSANDLWSLSLATGPAWTSLAPAGSPPRDRLNASLVFDSARGRLLVHGGSPGGGGPQTAGETWSLSLAPALSWSELRAPPPGRRYVPTVLDDATGRMVVFAGMQQDGVFLNDLWARDLAADGSWTPLTPGGSPPAPRWSHSAVLDGSRHRMVIFGGLTASSFNDVWALSLGASPAWTPIVPDGTPPAPRSGHVAVYDPIGDRMVVFGGAGSNLPQDLYNDTWALTFSPVPTWTQLAPAGTPPSPRYWMAAAFDTKRRHMLVIGGTGAGDLWSLSLAGAPAWTQLAVAGAPPARLLPAAVYDPIGDRLIVFGGVSDTPGEGNAAWALSLSGPMAWTRLSPAEGLPAERAGHGAVFDIAHNRMVMFGGFTPGQGINTIDFDDTWSIAFEPPAPTGVPPASPSAAFALGRAQPNPAARHLAVSISLAEPGPATLELLDVTGRRLRTHGVGDLGVGPHLVELDREVQGLEPGVYLVRLRQGAHVAATKICVVR